MRHRSILFTMVIVLVAMAGCKRKASLPDKAGKGSSARSSNESVPVIGVSLLTKTHDFYKDLEKGLHGGAKKHKMELKVASAEFEIGQQHNQMEDFVTQKVSAIVVCPADSRGIVAAIEMANEKGIPVFTADIAAEGGNVVSHIATDNVAGGRLAGEYMKKLLPEGGKIVIIDVPEAESVMSRVKGFEEAIAGSRITVVEKPYGAGKADVAHQAMEDMLTKYEDLDGVFAINDDTALGALAAIEAAARSQEIVIVGYDATPPAREAILRNSSLKADVVQYPEIIGRTTMDTIADHLSGKKVEPFVWLEAGIVDEASLTANEKAKGSSGSDAKGSGAK